MQYEMRALKEFSRIFPPEKRIVDKAYGEDPEGDEDAEGTRCLYCPLSVTRCLLL
jgi:hypothetical protein